MAPLNKYRATQQWTITDTYGLMNSYIAAPSQRAPTTFAGRSKASLPQRHSFRPSISMNLSSRTPQLRLARSNVQSHQAVNTRSTGLHTQRRHFHNYFVTHLPSTSLHPDSRSPAGPHHKLPRAAAKPHDPSSGPPPAASPPGVGRDLTVVRIPIQSAKHHFGAARSRGERPYNEDTYQAGTIGVPAFAKRMPMSLARNESGKLQDGTGTSASGASGDPQVFYFGVFDGHGGTQCAEFLKDELHGYIERAADEFGLQSSLKRNPDSVDDPATTTNADVVGIRPEEDLSKKAQASLDAVDMKEKSEVNTEHMIEKKEQIANPPPAAPRVDSVNPVPQRLDKKKAFELEADLMQQWKDTVGGYFRRFKPEFFNIPPKHRDHKAETHQAISEAIKPPTIETVLMYAFLRCDLDFIVAQASKPESDAMADLPLNNNEVLGKPSMSLQPSHVGGPTRFKGGSTASIAMISTPSPAPFWHPSSPSTIMVAHVGDTRILLCETATGLAVPMTTNHHPSDPGEGTRLRRYAATFVTDSFGEERMSGLANTRSFGDMRSKRIGVTAEPEIVRVQVAPAQYSFMVLMSDGISGTLTDQEVVDVVKEAKTCEQAANEVVKFATEVSRDGDNATCLVVRLGGWERRGEGGLGSLGTKEVRDFRRQDASDPRRNRR